MYFLWWDPGASNLRRITEVMLYIEKALAHLHVRSYKIIQCTTLKKNKPLSLTKASGFLLSICFDQFLKHSLSSVETYKAMRVFL